MSDINVSQIPQELQARRQWVIWREEDRGGKKPTKVPYCAMFPGQKASSSNPNTWASFEEAYAAYQLQGASGIGFVFSENDPYVGIDIDDPAKVEEIRSLFYTYAERSWSGRGIHLIAQGSLKGKGMNSASGVEVYDRGRYFVVTGEKLEDAPVGIRTEQDAIDELMAEYGKAKEPPKTGGLGHYDDSAWNRQRYINWLTHRRPAVEGQTGDNWTYKTAAWGRDKALSEQAVMECLLVEGGWNSKCQPPWEEEELAEKVASAFRNARNDAGTDHPDVIMGFGLAGDAGSPDPAAPPDLLLPEGNILPDHVVAQAPATAIRKPDDGSADLAKIQDRVGRMDPGDMNEMEAVLRECVYLSTPIRREVVINQLASPPFGLSKTYLRQTINGYRTEVLQHLPNDAIAWVDVQGDGETPKATHTNLKQVLDKYNVGLRWNEMSHQYEYDLSIRGKQTYHSHDGTVDENLGFAYIKNQCIKEGFPVNIITENLHLVAMEEKYHPFVEYLEQEQWDGVPRLDRLLSTLKVDPGHRQLRERIMKTWLTSVVAAVRGYGDMVPKGVLVLVGPQSIGKTSWLRYLCPEGMFGEGQHLDPHNKDSKMLSTRYLMVELGELDSTFNKSDIASLKAHISNASDHYRRPYDRGVSEFKRQTIYAGTVNEPQFLQDDTGNVRFWPLAVVDIDLDTIQQMKKSGELRQVWLEVEAYYRRGEQLWYFEREELDSMLEHIDVYRSKSEVEESLEDNYDWMAPLKQWRRVTITALKVELGIYSKNQSHSRVIKQVVAALTKEYQKGYVDPYAGKVKKVAGKSIRTYLVPPLAVHGIVSNENLEFTEI